jgi:ABC-type glycerol-3-phosphate transport system substrate-binding protein
MGLLSKKSILVSLLALSLAACPSPATKPPPTTTIDLPCDGDAGSHGAATTITFKIKTGLTCDLVEVDFIQDPHKNYNHFTRHRSATAGAATSGDPPVVFTYDGQPILGDGAFFYYVTKSTNSPNPDPGGGGYIH